MRKNTVPLNGSNISNAKRGLVLVLLATLGFFSCEERKVGHIGEKSGVPKTDQKIDKRKTQIQSGQYTVKPLVLKEGRGVFEILPKPGFKINVEYPWKMSPAESSVGVKDIKLDKQKAILELTVPKKLEHSTLSISANFSVCNDDKCLIYRDEKIEVAQAP